MSPFSIPCSHIVKLPNKDWRQGKGKLNKMLEITRALINIPLHKKKLSNILHIGYICIGEPHLSMELYPANPYSTVKSEILRLKKHASLNPPLCSWADGAKRLKMVNSFFANNGEQIGFWQIVSLPQNDSGDY